MALEILRDPRLRGVEWRDLCPQTRLETALEASLSLPWLAGSLALAHAGLWLPALAASFAFFLCGLRQVHGAFHHSTGLGRRGDAALMFALSAVMLGSMHAVMFNHVRHHRHCLGAEDVEGRSARLPAWRALVAGPRFPLALHRTALALGSPSLRRWVWVELAAGLAVAVLAFGLLDWAALRYHVAAMAAGQCLTAFFAVWTVHHDCDRSHFIARTLRHPLKSRITYHMFFHVEHHLFPSVPTRRLPALARRLDRAAPELASRRVF